MYHLSEKILYLSDLLRQRNDVCHRRFVFCSRIKQDSFYALQIVLHYEVTSIPIWGYAPVLDKILRCRYEYFKTAAELQGLPLGRYKTKR